MCGTFSSSLIAQHRKRPRLRHCQCVRDVAGSQIAIPNQTFCEHRHQQNEKGRSQTSGLESYNKAWGTDWLQGLSSVILGVSPSTAEPTQWVLHSLEIIGSIKLTSFGSKISECTSTQRAPSPKQLSWSSFQPVSQCCSKGQCVATQLLEWCHTACRV